MAYLISPIKFCGKQVIHIIFSSVLTLELSTHSPKTVVLGWSGNTVGRRLALHTADRGSSPSTTYDPWNPVRNKPQTPLSVAQMKKDTGLPLHFQSDLFPFSCIISGLWCITVQDEFCYICVLGNLRCCVLTKSVLSLFLKQTLQIEFFPYSVLLIAQISFLCFSEHCTRLFGISSFFSLDLFLPKLHPVLPESGAS